MGWSKAWARSSCAAMNCAWARSSAWPRRPTTSASSAIILSSPSRWDWRRVPQIRNMASLGGNVMQRTRCEYFRDTSWTHCNKRAPGAGCAALQGVNRKHAVLGVSDQCIATYGGDFAQALIALRATAHLSGPRRTRNIAFEQFHLGPDKPEVETILEPGEMITGFSIPSGPWTKRSLYLKIRDRESYTNTRWRAPPWRLICAATS